MNKFVGPSQNPQPETRSITWKNGPTMSIPLLKRQSLEASRNDLIRLTRVPLPVGGGPTSDEAKPQRGPKQGRGKALAALGLLVAAGLFVGLVPETEAQAGCAFTENFEGDTLSIDPTGCWYTTPATGGDNYVVASPAQGTRALVIGTTSTNALVDFTFKNSVNWCGLLSGGSVSWKMRATSLGTADGGSLTVSPGNSAIFGYDGSNVRLSVADASVLTTGANVVPAFTWAINTWYQMSISITDAPNPPTETNNACTTGGPSRICATVSDLVGGTPSSACLDKTINGAASTNFQHFRVFGNAGTIYTDDIEFGLATGIPSAQIAVVGLTGGSMDASGRNIVARTTSGTTINTYALGETAGAPTISAITSTTTPTCAAGATPPAAVRFDGVNAADYLDQDGISRVYITWLDCDADGESDSFKIRYPDLTVPVFPCPQATENIDNNGQVDIPNNMKEIGTISDLNPSYVGRCDDGPGIDGGHASVGWGFGTVSTPANTVDGGRIGVFAATYNNGVIDEGTDEASVQLDTSAFPQITQFCSWQGINGRDFIGGTSGGITAVYEVISSVVSRSPALGLEPELQLVNKFSNSGLYATAGGIACAEESIVIENVPNLYLINGIGSTPTPASAPWPLSMASPVGDKGVAMTGSGRFIAYADSGLIKVVARNGTQTGSFPIPSGLWRGMEFDNSGSKLAVYTSTFITLFKTTTITCEVSDTCLEDEGIQCEGCDPTGTSTSTSGTGGPGGPIEDNPYFWVLLWIVLGVIATAILSWITRGGFPGLVYGVVALIVYIFGILIYGADKISAWPILAVMTLVIGLAIARFATR